MPFIDLVQYLMPFPLEYLIVPYVVYLGVRVSKQDFRTNTIPNAAIWQGTKVGLAWCVLMLVWAYYPPVYEVQVWGYEPFPFWLMLPLNSLLCWLIGFILWYMDLWSAGDGKWFGVLSLFLTPGVYRETLVPYFPAFVHLMNTFMIVFLIICAEFLFYAVVTGFQRGAQRSTWSRMVKWLRLNFWNLVRTGLLVFVLLMFIVNSRKWMALGISQFIDIDQFTMYLLLFVVFEYLRKIAERPGFLWLLGLAFAGWIGLELWALQSSLEYSVAELADNILKFSNLTIALMVFSITYYGLSPIFFSRRIHPRELEPGMVLSKATSTTIHEHPTYAETFGGSIGNIEGKALTSYDINHIRNWYANQPMRFDFYTEKHIPFAPGIFLGAIITYATGGPLIYWTF